MIVETLEPLARADPSRLPAIAARAATDGVITLPDAEAAASGCRACPLWEGATQSVFGRGPVPARLMLIGEQPGDREDHQGEPFVGPAGRVLDDALARAGIDRETVFLTNVVKHFKWRPVPGSKRRLHERPNRAEIGACLPWVATELALVRPESIVLLGATATAALVGPRVRVTRDHGRAVASRLARYVVPTIHPSAVLRKRGSAGRAEALDGLVADLRNTVALLRGPAST